MKTSMLHSQLETAQSLVRLPKCLMPLNAPRVSAMFWQMGCQPRVLDSVGRAAGGDEKYLKALQQQQMPLLQQLKGAAESCDQSLCCAVCLTFHHRYSRALKKSWPLCNSQIWIFSWPMVQCITKSLNIFSILIYLCYKEETKMTCQLLYRVIAKSGSPPCSNC